MDFTQQATTALNKLNTIYQLQSIIDDADEISSLFGDDDNIYANFPDEEEYLNSISDNSLTDFLACEPSKKTIFEDTHPFMDKLEVIDNFFDANALSGDENFLIRKKILSAIVEGYSDFFEEDYHGHIIAKSSPNIAQETRSLSENINNSYSLNASSNAYVDTATALLRFSKNLKQSPTEDLLEGMDDAFVHPHHSDEEDARRAVNIRSRVIESNLDIIRNTPDITSQIVTERQEIFHSLLSGENIFVTSPDIPSNTLEDRSRKRTHDSISE